ncbi:hypothetical protein [Nocardiopsis suaedae]|uniref:Uncharacterized protein n=1 Tax=Nocardiopsis suaedae TaxID=3018444 RepID=A0ABT4TID1_9ACTN|nr:hypothetical protein [Nocardiopsis suaedae]MDA2804453.1 hypothetical protein [Nocardiopsis suaedae]
MSSNLLIPESTELVDNEILTSTVQDLQQWALTNSQDLHDRAALLEVGLRYAAFPGGHPMMMGLDQRAAAYRVASHLHRMGEHALHVGTSATKLIGSFNALFLQQPESQPKPAKNPFVIK